MFHLSSFLYNFFYEISHLSLNLAIQSTLLPCYEFCDRHFGYIAAVDGISICAHNCLGDIRS